MLIDLLFEAIVGIGAMSSAGAGGWLVQRFCKGEYPLQSARKVMLLVTVGALGGCMISPTIGVLTLSLAGTIPFSQFGYSWLTWWVGDAAGTIIIAPLILAWFYPQPFSSNPRRTLESFVLGGLTLLLCYFAFFRNTHLEYVLMPLLLWASFRFGVRGASMVAAAIAILATIGTSQGGSPFVLGTVNESLLFLHSFLAVNVISALFLAGLLGERKRAESTLRESEAKFHTLFDAAHDAIFVSDENVILSCNPQALTLFGGKPEDIIGHSPAELAPATQPDGRLSRDKVREKIERALAGQPQFFELRHLRLDQTPFDAEVSLNRIEFGGKIYLQAIVRDITARTRAEAALQARDAELLSILESTGDGILAVDKTGKKVLKANRRFAEMWRIPQSMVDAGDNHAMMDFVREQLTDPDAFLKNESRYNSEATGMDTLDFKDGRIFESHAFPMMLEEIVTGRVWAFRDVTARKQAEAERRKIEEQHRTILRTAMDGFWSVDLQGRILETNDAYCRMSGYSEQELLALRISDLEASMTPDRIATTFQMIIARGEARFETRHRRKDGSLFDVEVSVQFQPDENKCVTFLRDITERKQAEAALRESEVKFSLAFANAPVLLSLSDPDTGRYTEINNEGLRITGFSREEVIGKTSIEIGWISPEDRARLLAILKEHGRVSGIEMALHAKGGRKVMCLVHCEVVSIRGRQQLLMTSHDITERKRGEEAIRESERRLTTLLSNLPGMAYRCRNDAEWTMEFVSAGVRQLTGYAPEDIIGNRRISYGRIIVPEDRDRVWNQVQKALAQKVPFILEYRIRTVTGEERWVWEQGRGIFGENDALTCLEGFVMNITEHKLAEDALRQSEQSYRNLFELESDALFLVDAGSHAILDCNQAAQKLYGYRREELLKLKAEDVSGEPEKTRQTVGSGQYFIPVRWHRKKDGTRFPVEITASRIQHQGRPAELTALRDITERKRAEAALYQSEAEFKDLFNNAPVGFHELDAEGRLIRINQTELTLLGYSAEELLGQFVWKINAEEEKARQITLAKLSGEQPVLPEGFERMYRRKDGSAFTVWINDRILKREDGSIIGIRSSIQDVTEHKRVEESHARLALAVEQAAETIVITDTSGTILYANPAFEKTTGYTRTEALGQNPRVLKSGKHDTEFYRRMWETLARGEVWTGHFVNKRKDGTLFDEEAVISPVRDAAGQVVNYVAVKRDVTRERQLESQLRQTQKMESIGTLAGGVAHDFNNVLAIIQMQASLLKSSGNLSAKQLQFADEIGITVQRAADLTRQLLLFSRREAPQPHDLDWSAAIVNTTKMVQRILGEHIEVQINLAATPMFVHADPGMMDQVLMNLAVNARDAMPNGGQLTIAIESVKFDEVAAAQSAPARAGSFVCLSVSDTGGGIPPEILPRIFEPFFTTKGVGKGTGLGLATVFGIVQQHQGWINVHSEVGHGTTFKIYLPRLAGPTAQNITENMPAPTPAGNETILLVEDEPTLRGSIRTVLVQLGYRVLEAPTGVKALEVWREHPEAIGLLLTDMLMPGGMTGRDLAQRLLGENPKLKVVYMSGYTAEVVGRDFPLQEGVNFIAKPVAADKLAKTIRDSLDLRAGGTPGSPGIQ